MFNSENSKNKDLYFILALSFIFFILAVIINLQVGYKSYLGNFSKMNNDDVKYIRSAWTFVKTGMITYESPEYNTVFIMPGITIALGFFMSIFGKLNGLTMFRIFQCAAISASLYYIYCITYHIFKNKKIAFIAFIIDATYISEMFVTNVILTEALFKFLFVALIYYTMVALETKKVLYYIIAGVFWGMTMLFRPVTALFPIVVLLMWYILKYSLREQLKFAFIVAIVGIILICPWWIRNYHIYNRFIPFTESSGNPKYLALNYNLNIKPTEVEKALPLTDEGYNQKVKLMTTRLFKDNPVNFIYSYTIKKGYALFEKPFYLNSIFNIKFFPDIQQSFLFFSSLLAAIFYFKNIKFYNIIGLILPFSFIYLYIIYIPYVSFSRYGYPFMWMLFIPLANLLYNIFFNKS